MGLNGSFLEYGSDSSNDIRNKLASDMGVDFSDLVLHRCKIQQKGNVRRDASCPHSRRTGEDMSTHVRLERRRKKEELKWKLIDLFIRVFYIFFQSLYDERSNQ